MEVLNLMNLLHETIGTIQKADSTLNLEVCITLFSD